MTATIIPIRAEPDGCIKDRCNWRVACGRAGRCLDRSPSAAAVDTDPGYDAVANSTLGYEHALAALRLRVVIARSFATYPFGNPGSKSVSGHIASELVREYPGLLDFISKGRGGGEG